jgi:hypothetical protein
MSELNNEQIAPPNELTLLSTDRELAAAAITRHLDSAAEDGLSDEQVQLLELQLLLAGVVFSNQQEGFDSVRVSEVLKKRYEYEKVIGKRGFETDPDLVRARFADEERWRIAGIDPTKYIGHPVTAEAVAATWREAAKAKQDEQIAVIKRQRAEAASARTLDLFIDNGLAG